MATAKIFRSGGSQAVRLPKEFRFSGSEVEIFREGDRIILREPMQDQGLARAFELLTQLPDDFEVPDDPPPEERKW